MSWINVYAYLSAASTSLSCGPQHKQSPSLCYSEFPGWTDDPSWKRDSGSSADLPWDQVRGTLCRWAPPVGLLLQPLCSLPLHIRERLGEHVSHSLPQCCHKSTWHLGHLGNGWEHTEDAWPSGSRQSSAQVPLTPSSCFYAPLFPTAFPGWFFRAAGLFWRWSLGFWGHSEQALREPEVPRNLHPPHSLALGQRLLSVGAWKPLQSCSSLKPLGGIRGTIQSSPGAQADTRLTGLCSPPSPSWRCSPSPQWWPLGTPLQEITAGDPQRRASWRDPHRRTSLFLGPLPRLWQHRPWRLPGHECPVLHLQLCQRSPGAWRSGWTWTKTQLIYTSQWDFKAGLWKQQDGSQSWIDLKGKYRGRKIDGAERGEVMEGALRRGAAETVS